MSWDGEIICFHLPCEPFGVDKKGIISLSDFDLRWGVDIHIKPQ